MTKEGSQWILTCSGCAPELRNSKLRLPESFIMGNYHAPLEEIVFITPDSKEICLLGKVVTVFQGCLPYKYPKESPEQRLISAFGYKMSKVKRHMENYLPPLFRKRFFTSYPK